MSLPSQRPFVGLGRFGKVSGLMICLERGRSRSSSQAPGGLGAVGSGPPAKETGVRWPAWDTSAAVDTLFEGDCPERHQKVFDQENSVAWVEGKVN